MITEILKKLVEKKDLEYQEIENVINEISNQRATQAQIAALLTALRMKGEAPQEIASFAKVMRSLARKLDFNYKDLFDTAGTGGDGLNTFNISTATALILASAGIKVAKHGNRSISSKSGSADVLEELGVNIHAEPIQLKNCIEQANFCFIFAPDYHTSTAKVSPIRKELGFRTIFNYLGPLTNPAKIERQIIGVPSTHHASLISNSLKYLEIKKAIVVHGYDGMDEFSLSSKNLLFILENGELNSKIVEPEELGLKKVELQNFVCKYSLDSAKIIYKIISNEIKLDDPRSQIVQANVSLGLYAADKASDFKEGISYAKELIESGKAVDVLEKIIKITEGNLEKFEAIKKNV